MARIAFVLGNDFEDSEFRQPFEALRAAGHYVEVVGRKAGEVVRGTHGDEVRVDAAASDRDSASYDALVIPGGYSPDHLRTDKHVVRFVQGFVRHDKLVAAVCRGPQLLIEADAVEGRKLTSWPSVRTDLLNAGAKWLDREVIIDDKLITSRKPADLPAFIAEIRKQLGQRELRHVG